MKMNRDNSLLIGKKAVVLCRGARNYIKVLKRTFRYQDFYLDH